MQATELLDRMADRFTVRSVFGEPVERQVFGRRRAARRGRR
jgi:hypothetical protein